MSRASSIRPERLELAPGTRVTLQLLRLSALLTMVIVLVVPTSADPDLWGHVRFGHDIVSSGSLHRSDPYSFTSDRPWINHEWLAEVLMSLAYGVGEARGLVALKTVIVGLVLWCILASLRGRDWQPTNHDLLIVVALVGMFSRYHPVRPQLFSLLLFALLLLALQKAERGNRRWLLGIPPIFAVWANLHGGFLVGLGILAIWLVADVVRLPEIRTKTLALGAAAVIATLVTPHGIDLWRFLAETVGPSRPAIKDWQPAITARPIVLGPWLLVLVTAGWAMWRGRGGVTGLVPTTIVIVLAVASARVGRLDAFLAIAVVMLLGPAFAGSPIRRSGATLYRPRWAVFAVLIIAVCAVYAFSRRASCIEMRAYPEPEATELLAKHQGRLLSFFDWGQYAIWHLSPQLKVSMDGRRETVYSPAMIDLHMRLYAGAPEAVAQVSSLAPDVIWLPASSPAAVALARRDWNVAFRGPVSVILARQRQPDEPPVQVHGVERVRCFPDR